MLRQVQLSLAPLPGPRRTIKFLVSHLKSSHSLLVSLHCIPCITIHIWPLALLPSIPRYQDRSEGRRGSGEGGKCSAL